MELIALGTSGGAPTKRRNCTSFILKNESYGIMLDCAEGTQRQMIHAGYKMSKIRYIFISHLHLDHIGGLVSMLSTKSMFSIPGNISIIGPKGIKDFIEFNLNIANSGLSYQIDVFETEDGSLHEFKGFKVRTYLLKHRIDSYGYRIHFDQKKGNIIKEKLESFGLEEGPVCGKLKRGEKVELKDGRTVILKDVATDPVPGKIIAYVPDTHLAKGIYKTAMDSDMMIIESTFLNEDEDRASDRTHLTSGMAGNLAQRCNVKKLVLFHFSAAYTDLTKFYKEAEEKFEGLIFTPQDLDIIEI